MRAEARLRKSSDTASALEDVNIVRASRTLSTPAPPLASMDLDLLFRERGFEFYWEMQRRTDMIRFGKYEGTGRRKTTVMCTKEFFRFHIRLLMQLQIFPDTWCKILDISSVLPNRDKLNENLILNPFRQGRILSFFT